MNINNKILMQIFKNIFLLFLIYIATIWVSFAWWEEQRCISSTNINIKSETVLKRLSDDDRLRFVYCLVDEYEWENVENEEDIIESDEQSVVDRASSEERKILLAKRSVLQKENKDLWYWERQTLVEINTWLDCGWKLRPGESNNIVTCIKDPRKQAFKMYQLDDSKLWWVKRWFNSVMVSIVNGILFAFSEFVSNSAFGYAKFDELPNIPYENIGSMFDVTTLYGMINSFSLAILWFVILYYFLKTGTGRWWDDYKLFVMKVLFVLVFVLFFSFLYKGLQSSITLFETSLIDSTSKLTSLDQTNVIDGIRMDTFQLGALTSVTLWTIIFFIPNVIALLFISILIYMRDIFLITLLNVFFLSAVWFLWGTLKKGNVFEGTSVSAKLTKFSVYAMFWMISLFITVVSIIFLFKFITVIWASIPSIETEGVSLVGNINNFSIDAFIYLLLLIGVIIFWKKFLIKVIFNGVSNFLTDLFFPEAKWVGWYNDLVSESKDWYNEVKMSIEDLKENNPIFKDVKSKVAPVIDKTSELVKKNEYVKSTTEFLDKKQQWIRDSLRPIKNTAKIISWVATWGFITERKDIWKVIKAWITATTGVWATYLTSTDEYFDKVEEINTEIQKLQSERAPLDEKALKDKPRITKIDTYIKKLKRDKRDLEKEAKHSLNKNDYERVKTITSKINKLNNRLEKIDAKEGSLSNKNQTKEIGENINKLKKEKEELEAKLDTQESYDRLEEIKEDFQELQSERASLDNTSMKNKPKIREIEANMKKLEKDKDSIEKKLEEVSLDSKSDGEWIKEVDDWDINIPDSLLKDKKTNISNKDIKEEKEITDSEDILDKDMKENRESVSSDKEQDFLKEEIEEFKDKYNSYKETYDEKVFWKNPIFKHLYEKEIKRAGGEDFIDIEILNSDIQDTLKYLNK